jgi:hypothetical protein
VKLAQRAAEASDARAIAKAAQRQGNRVHRERYSSVRTIVFDLKNT